ncbi:hypothetical protein TCAL_15819 [Tigriopus californicus]|uniref:Uncharacterized protein n=1 Tax=Tigriopus californicus TaxID=6832 RepID=A0A553NNT7_TIGCA|nr:hypothetical protein TCAL_15819 [Tigriopus californicus]
MDLHIASVCEIQKRVKAEVIFIGDRTTHIYPINLNFLKCPQPKRLQRTNGIPWTFCYPYPQK